MRLPLNETGQVRSTKLREIKWNVSEPFGEKLIDEGHIVDHSCLRQATRFYQVASVLRGNPSLRAEGSFFRLSGGTQLTKQMEKPAQGGGVTTSCATCVLTRLQESLNNGLV
jgi:hypothetical protein